MSSGANQIICILITGLQSTLVPNFDLDQIIPSNVFARVHFQHILVIVFMSTVFSLTNGYSVYLHVYALSHLVCG